MDSDLHSPERLLIELTMAHADLDAQIDSVDLAPARDDLAMRRLKKRRLALRDEISRLQAQLSPGDSA